MDIFVQKDKDKRQEFLAQELAEITEAARPRGMFEDKAAVSFKAGDQLMHVTHTAVEDVMLTPAQTLKAQRREEELAQRAEVRQSHCWMREGFACTGKAMYHVREVKFDLRERDAVQKQAFVSTDDYPGPVPGFCMDCISKGPIALAEAVYKSRPEIQWGFQPNRWFVVFTDGSSQGGMCQEIDTRHVTRKFVHDHMNGDTP